jgi:hypothetical protein
MGDQVPAIPNGRDIDGRFAAGNKLSLGNAGNRRQRELRTALVEAATPEKVRAVEESLHEVAVGGDVAAAKVWLDHVVGKPVQAVELSGPDGFGSREGRPRSPRGAAPLNARAALPITRG